MWCDLVGGEVVDEFVFSLREVRWRLADNCVDLWVYQWFLVGDCLRCFGLLNENNPKHSEQVMVELMHILNCHMSYYFIRHRCAVCCVMFLPLN